MLACEGMERNTSDTKRKKIQERAIGEREREREREAVVKVVIAEEGVKKKSGI